MALPAFTLADARRRVDYHLRDRDGGSESFSMFEKNVAIESAMRLLAPDLLLADQWTIGLVTVTTATDTFLLPTATAQQYDRLKRLRLGSNGTEIPIVSLEVFETYREGQTTNQPGTPVVAMVIEGESAAPSLRLWPISDRADTLDGFFSRLPAALGHLDSAAIPVDEQAFESICYSAALELYGKMPQAEREKRGLGDGTPALWPGRIAAGVRATRNRRRRQQGGQVTLRRRRW